MALTRTEKAGAGNFGSPRAGWQHAVSPGKPARPDISGLTSDEQAIIAAWADAIDANVAAVAPTMSGAAATAVTAFVTYQATPAYQEWLHRDLDSREAQYRLRQVDAIDAVHAAGTISKSADPAGVGRNAPLTLTSTEISVDTFDTPGAFSIVVPVGKTHVDIEVWQPGAGGARGSGTAKGGGAGAYSKKSQTLVAADWGTTISGVVGTGGAGRTASSGNGISPSTGSSITSVSLNSVTVAIAVGTQPSGSTGAGGTATGGDVNVVGGDGSAMQGGNAPLGGDGGSEAQPGEFPGGGGGGGLNADSENGGDGAHGRVKFTWT